MTRTGKATARQVLLPEVGPEGQQRIEAAPAELPSELNAAEQWVFLAYTRGAGQTTEKEVPLPAALDQLSSPLVHPRSREVARGALAALFSIKSALRHP